MQLDGPSPSFAKTLLRKLGRLARFLLFLGTSGWLFPHAATEGMDLTEIQNRHRSKAP